MRPATDCLGLLTTNPSHRIALRGVHLSARISGMSCKAVVEQTFVNLESQAIEAVYTFPLPEGAAVCGFEVITGDRVLTGRIEDAEQAIEQYDQAISEGHGAFVVEQERPDVFTARIGNLKPGQAATIRLTYICALERVDRSIRVAFPTTVAPRYATATATDPIEAAVDRDALNPPHVLFVPYGMSAQIDVDLGRELKSITSPSHRVQVGESEQQSRVALSGGVCEMDRDLVLLIDLKKEHEPRVQVSRGPEGESYLAVTFIPEFDEDELAEPRASETIFVLDCSGSMQGDSIAQAMAALELCLRSMSVGDTFNICRFGSTWEMLASEPLVYSQQTLDRAIDYVRQSRDLGGTELHTPLKAILSQPPRAGTVRNVILLTDGQVANEPAVVDLARKHRRHNRIFSFGIGSACSSFLVKGLARASGGAAEFITAGERIDEKVLRTFSRLASPPVTDVQIDWDGADVQTLAEIPPIFDGDVLAIFGRSPTGAPRKVTLSCTTAAGARSWSLSVPAPHEDGGVIATMWARRMIQSLEEINNIAATRTHRAKKSRERDVLIRLSKEFGLLCSLTTFIAMEHRSLEERNEGKPALRRVPVKLAAGWGAMDEVLGSLIGAAGGAAPAQAIPKRRRGIAFGLAGSVMRCMAPAAPPARHSIDKADAGSGLLDLARESNDEMTGVPKRPERGPDGRRSIDQVFPDQPVKGAPRKDKSDDQLKRLLAMQQASGEFAVSDADIFRTIRSAGHDVNLWAQMAADAVEERPDSSIDAKHATPTLLTLLLLHVYYKSRVAMWKRAGAKAERFLAQLLKMNLSDVRSWLQELEKKVEKK